MCKKTKKYTQEEILQLFKEVRGETYTYENFVYINSYTPSMITCKIHGDFPQSSQSHLNGASCRKCYMIKKYAPNEQSRNIFIDKSNEIYDNKYDYTKVVFTGNKNIVTITCPIHGDFDRTPKSHLKGYACNDCSGTFRYTTESFVEKAKLIHSGDSYDYSKVKYVDSKSEITIRCLKHGDFNQIASSHLRGSRCKDCSLNVPTTQEYIEKAIIVHGDTFEYKKCVYVDSETPVIITCKIHGDFPQRPSSHLSGCGCRECGLISTSVKLRFDNAFFIEKAIDFHGEIYDYTKVVYINSYTPVKVICKKHTEFSVVPYAHWRGSGCPICSREASNRNQSKSTEQFIEDAVSVHGDEYDYSLVDYINSSTVIKVICKKHKEFNTVPSRHLQGAGCPKCYKGVRLTKEEMIENFEKKHNYKFDYTKMVYVNNYTKITIICPVHGDFPQTPANHAMGTGCPQCRSSKGERAVHRFLGSVGVNYTIQKMFEDCRSPLQNHRFPFDVYLPDYNICIEYDGEMHYHVTEYFGGEEKLKSTQTNDAIKTAYCLSNNIPLLRIPYTEFKNIDNILTIFLKEHGVDIEVLVPEIEKV